MTKSRIIVAALLCLTTIMYAGGKQELVGHNTYEYNIEGFTGIHGSAAFEIEVQQSDKFSVRIIAEKSQIDKLIIEKRGNNLFLGMKPFSGFIRKSPRAIITMPELRKVDLSGSSGMLAAGFSSNRDFNCDLSGASSLDIDIIAGDIIFDLSGSSDVTAVLEGSKIEIELSGSSDIKLTGKGSALSADAGGASSGDLEDFRVSSADIELSGSSDFHVNLNGTLSIDASGASTLYYTGNVTLGNIELSGASSIKEE